MNYKTYEVRVYESGDHYWYLNGKRHREDGPAIEFSNGHKEWYINDKRHREDGPAVEFANSRIEWWLNNKRYATESAWRSALNPDDCAGKVVEIEGRKYKLQAV